MKNRLLELLKKYAYANREVTLASGQKSNVYIDCKQVMFRGEAQFLAGKLFYDQMQQLPHHENLAACSGMELGAVPLATALSMTAFADKRELPAIVVRKETKGHGTGAFLEGANAIDKNARVLLVEDVVTTGGSTLKAAQRLRAHGFVVDNVFALVDRLAGGRENLREAGLELFSLYSLKDFTS